MRIPLFVPVVLLCGFLVHGCSGSGDNCTPNNRTICKDGVVYWVDSCGNQGDKAGDCDCGCNADFTACKTPCDCEPNCQGKECGPDGCDGTCLPGCSGGDTCNEQTGQCECAPNCTGKECGSDGCGSECPPGCGSGESCSAEGICISTGCGSVPLSVQGTLDTGGANVEFDHVEASFTHKRDIDEYEDGCIVQVDVSLMNSTGCQLHVVAGNRYNGDGALVVQSFEFSADSFCPNFPDTTEGAYANSGGLTTAEVEMGVTEVPGHNVATSCASTFIKVKLGGVVTRVGDNSEMVVNPTVITISGDFFSEGNTEVSCPCVGNCQGKECGEDGCGGSCSPGCGVLETCNNGLCETVWLQITGGTYQMGSDAGDFCELPVHSVTVPSFEMSKTEVTVDQYQACVDAGTCTLPDDNTSNSYCNWGYSDRGAHPVNCVDWNQAVAFCTWAGGRLPSEAEWEYAARSGGQDITYPWGDDTATCQYVVMNEGVFGCGQDSTWAACGKTAGNTAQGLCDMAGNVYEWVQDWFHNDYIGAPVDGSAWEGSGSFRVIRGGGFGNLDVFLRAAYRYYGVPSDRYDFYGFRCAR